MTQPSLARIAGAATLAAALTLALPSRAEAAGLRSSESLWGRLVVVLEGRIAAFWGQTGRDSTPTAPPTKQGVCIDPNGLTTCVPGAATHPGAGTGTDPKG